MDTIGSTSIDTVRGTVARVVAGRLLYVDLPAQKGTIAFTPDKLTLRESDGSERRYRGEPFSDLGLKAGVIVEVIMDGGKGRQVVLKSPTRTVGFPNSSGRVFNR